MSAAEILHKIAGQDGGNLDEEMMVLDEMDSPIPARVRKARELGYWEMSAEGVVTLTAKGLELAGAAQ